MRRYVGAIERAVQAEVMSDLDSLAAFDANGNLTSASRRRIRAALDDAAEDVRETARPDVMDEVDTHVTRMRRVSLDMFEAQIDGLTDDPDTAADMRATADESDSSQTEDRAADRNADLMDSILNDTIDRLGDTLLEGLERGTTVEEREAWAEVEFEDAIELAQRRGDRIAAWESDSMNGEYAELWNLANELGLYTWITKEDERVRNRHDARHGQIYAWTSVHDEDPFDGHPGIPPACRCAAEPVLA